ncbi:MAG: hypothetical protein ACXADO_03645 [Candidatus Thorarchaeota archaeon]
MSTLRQLELAQVAPRLLELLRREGVGALTEFQAESVSIGAMRGTSHILVTYDYDEAYQIAEIALLNRVASDFRAKALVLCPNPHHAEKKYQSMSQKCRRIGIDASEIIRRGTAARGEWQKGRVIVSTFRAMDIAIRTRPEVIEGIECVLVDRLDLIGQPGLGARLETVLVSLMGMDTDSQYVAICPPVSDIPELAHWLGAEVVEDKKADVNVIFSAKAFESVEESLADLTEYVHYRRGQVMVLCANIPACEDLTARFTGISGGNEDASLDLRLPPEHRDDLRDAASDVRGSYSDCDMTRKLGAAVSKGVAFLHEGVSRAQRRRITQAWEEGILPVIVMPTRFAIASGLRATVVFLMGTFMQELGKELTQEESVTMLSEWQLNDVLQAAGRRGVDNEAFGIIVVDNEQERTRVLAKYFLKDPEGNISPIPGEVDSVMDDSENIQDLVLGQICVGPKEDTDPFSVIDRTFWATSKRMTGFSQGDLITANDTSVDQLVSLRTTKSTEKRAEEIPSESVRIVSLNPSKIEGLVHSGSREMWHYVSLRSADGVSCSCESWKYQGIRRHRLCKHLVRFARYALQDDETKPYAPSVIEQSLRGLETIGELEKDGLVQREKTRLKCTQLGKSVMLLGVPVRDTRKVIKALDEGKSDLEKILLNVAIARGKLPKDVLARVLSSVPEEGIEKWTCRDDELPGIVENCIEELDYVNLILLKLMRGKKKSDLRKKSTRLEKSLLELLETFR